MTSSRSLPGTEGRRTAAPRPLVSVVTPSLNQASFLEQAMRSVLAQDYPNLEYLVIDGGSTDGSVEIIERHRDRLAYFRSEADRGQAEAINKGLARATGEIVAWLNSDDVYLPGAIGGAVEALRTHPEAGAVYADGIMVDGDLTILDRHRYRPLSVLDLLSFEVILQPTVFMRRDALQTVGLLNPAYHLILDHELWVRLAARFPLHHVPSYWALERTHPQAKTIAQAVAFVEEAERLIAWASGSPELGDLVRTRRRRIEAGLDVFAARRLIDSGRHGQAFRRILHGLGHHPPTVLRYWYKAVQAGLSAVGLGPVFEWYRRTRRRLTYRQRRAL